MAIQEQIDWRYREVPTIDKAYVRATYVREDPHKMLPYRAGTVPQF